MAQRGLSTTEKGYGHLHQQERQRWRPIVDAGQADCCEIICLEARDGRGRHIHPGTSWDLAHNRATGEYLGPAHTRCNRAEGARYRNRRARQRHERPRPRRPIGY